VLWVMLALSLIVPPLMDWQRKKKGLAA
jgi:hypothetical protein